MELSSIRSTGSLLENVEHSQSKSTFGDTNDVFETIEASPRKHDSSNLWDFRESIREDIALIVHRETSHLAHAITKEFEKLSKVLFEIAKHPQLHTALELEHKETVPHSPKRTSRNLISKARAEVNAEALNAPPEDQSQLESANVVTSVTVCRNHDLEVERAFRGAEGGNDVQVRSFLQARGDPNAKMRAFKGKKKLITDCNLLPIAAVGGNVDVVRLLVGSRANVDGTYSFAAGSLNMPWTGTAQDAAVNRGELGILKELVKLRANIHRLASNQANLVWQAAYCGNRQILDYLLQHEVSHKIPAQSQDIAGVSFTPLHIATVQGHLPIIEVLLGAKADVQRKTEEGHSPLLDAILLGRADEIRLLISNGASLLDTMAGDNNVHFNRLMSCGGESADRSMCQVFACLFAERNPVLVHAAALGLSGQERQVERFTTAHVLQFMQKGNSDAVIAILKAIFRRREIIYRGKHHEKISMRTAMMPQAEHLKHMNVVESAYRFSDISELFGKRQRPDKSLKGFFKALFPHVKPWKHLRPHHMITVTVYESLVQDFHCDIEVMYYIARLSSFDPILETEQCLAIIRANWNAHIVAFVGQFLVQSVWVLVLLIISVLLLDACPSNEPCHYDARKHYKLRVLASLFVPLVIYETALELTAFSVFATYTWLHDYLRNVNHYSAWALIVSRGWVLSNIIFWRNQDHYYNRVVFAACCLLNWLYLLYALTPLRGVGIQVIPILFAIWEITPFLGVMFFFLAGMWHGYLALHFGDLHVFDAFTEIVKFALTQTTPQLVAPPYSPISSDATHGRFTLVVVLVCTFLLPIILMNTLLASVCNSYTKGIENIEKLYQSRRSQVVFALISRRKCFDSLSRMCGHRVGVDPDSPHKTLWYCVPEKTMEEAAARQSHGSNHYGRTLCKRHK